MINTQVIKKVGQKATLLRMVAKYAAASILGIEGLIYNLAQENHKNTICKHICDLPKYRSVLNFLSKQTLSKELKVYGDGYHGRFTQGN